MQAVLRTVFGEGGGEREGTPFFRQEKGFPPSQKVFLVLFLVLEHLHGAELAAHGADIFVLVVFTTLVQLLGIQRGFAHHVPVQGLAACVHGGFAAHGTFAAQGHFAHMSSHARGHDTGAHVFFIGQGQMLGRGQVAEEVHTGFHAQGTADGTGDVVVARGAVAAQGA